jgi:hypothetical protein
MGTYPLRQVCVAFSVNSDTTSIEENNAMQRIEKIARQLGDDSKLLDVRHAIATYTARDRHLDAVTLKELTATIQELHAQA